MQFAPALIVVALVVLIIVRRFQGAPVGARSAVLPVILVVYGITQMRGEALTATGIALIVAELAIGAGAGAARGYTIKLYERDGHLWQKYTALTVVVWLALIAVRGGFAFGAYKLGLTTSASATAMATVGASFVVESLVVARRAAATGVKILPRRGATPFPTGMPNPSPTAMPNPITTTPTPPTPTATEARSE